MVVSSLGRLKARIEASCERFGVSYPWWIPTYSTLASIAIAAYVQRGGVGSSGLVTFGLVLSLVPLLVWTVTARLLAPWIEAVLAVVAVAAFLTDPVTFDFAPFLLMVKAGDVAATSSTRSALGWATALAAVVIVSAALGHTDNAALYVIGVVVGADVGIALRWQTRALAAERRNSAIAEERAVLAERQRLAREVHDIVGHALSINLLHVTAARHTLTQHRDVDDAIECLVEAERAGRAAMGDIRRTVAVLASGPSETQPLPSVGDIASLVESSRQAGLDVGFECEGNVPELSAGSGLGLFRIVQESVANIAKHAPTSAATVRIAAVAGGVRLTVRNTLPDGPPATTAGGRGLPGMTARAEQMGTKLRAGPDADGWLVEILVPSDPPAPAPAVKSEPGCALSAAVSREARHGV